MQNKTRQKIHFLECWVIVAVRGNGFATPRFWSPVSSTASCLMGNVDPNGCGASSTYTVEMAWQNNGRTVSCVTESK